MSARQLLFFWLLFPVIALYGVEADQDTFRVKLGSIREDSSKVTEMVAYARTVLYSDPAKAFAYMEEAIALSQKISFPYGLAGAYRLKGAYYNDIQGNFKEAEKYLNLALEIYSRNKDYRNLEGKGAVYHSMGAMHQRSGDYLRAVEKYLEAGRILDSIGNKTILPRSYNNLSSLYAFIRLFDKAEYYARASLQQAKQIDDKQIISAASVTLSDALMAQGKYNGVPDVLKLADSISRQRNDLYIQLLCNYNYSTYFAYHHKDYKTALTYAIKAHEYSQKLNNPFELSRTLTNLAEHYNFSNNPVLALRFASQALDHAVSIQSTDMIQRAHFEIGVAYLNNGEFNNAASHLHKAAILKDSVILEVNRMQINLLEAMYQKEKREKEIVALENEKIINSLVIKRRNIIIITLLVSLILIGLFTWIYIRNIRNKKALAEKELQLQKQKVLEMEKQRQLDATLSVLQGEEAERSRLARDLHDGLGGLLSGLKLSLNSMKGNVLLSGSSVNQFDNAIGLLDNSIREMRRVAHNMMPEALVKYGLKDALSDFCNSLDNSIVIQFQWFGHEKRIDSNIEIQTYRIAQELINNALKHSGASELLVQLVQEEFRLHLTVQDNGKGFDMSLLKTSKGAGITNIRSRVESLNGILDVISEPGKGTEVSVEFKLNLKNEPQ